MLITLKNPSTGIRGFEWERCVVLGKNLHAAGNLMKLQLKTLFLTCKTKINLQNSTQRIVHNRFVDILCCRKMCAHDRLEHTEDHFPTLF